LTRLRSIKMISVERTDDNFPCKRSLISRAWDESFTITSNTMRHWWEEELPQYRRNGRKGIEQRNRKPTLLARANYDPTWRVKGNPICITRRASYRQRLRYLHYTHTLKDLFFSSLLSLPSPSILPGVADQVPLSLMHSRKIYRD